MRLGGTSAEGLNRLRAAVLGASDGIVSVAATLCGAAAAGFSPAALLTVALAATLAGAASMAAGEFVSVAAQMDAEREAHAVVSVSAVGAATSSALSFVGGAVLPAVAALCAPASWRVAATALTVLVTSGVCGASASLLSGGRPVRPALRVMTGAALALALTYAAGRVAGGAI